MWFGDGAGSGRWWVDWHDEISFLKARGFKVDVRLHDIRGQAFASPNDFYNSLAKKSQDKSLHGFFGWGHGNSSGFGVGDSSKPKKAKGKKIDGQRSKGGEGIWVTFQGFSSRLNYKLGAALLNSCNSNSGSAQKLIVSKHGIYIGHKAILDPSGTGLGGVWVGTDWSYRPSRIRYWQNELSPGTQGTTK